MSERYFLLNYLCKSSVFFVKRIIVFFFGVRDDFRIFRLKVKIIGRFFVKCSLEDFFKLF